MGWLEKWGLKLTSAKVKVEVEFELGNILIVNLSGNHMLKTCSTPLYKTKKAYLVLTQSFVQKRI